MLTEAVTTKKMRERMDKVEAFIVKKPTRKLNRWFKPLKAAKDKALSLLLI